MWTIERLFKDNYNYNSFDKLSNVGALAHAMTWLYTSEAEGPREGENYNLTYSIKLCDLMTVACFFIVDSTYELGGITIQGHIVDMKKDKRGDIYNSIFNKSDVFDYPNERTLRISCVSDEVVESILWASHVYAVAMSKHDTKRKVMWEKSTKLLLNLLKEESCLNARAFFRHHLVRNTQHAVEVMMKYMKAEKPKSDNEAKRQDVDMSAVDERVEHLVKENRELRESLQEAQTIPAHITAKQKVRMELARILLEKSGITEDVLGQRGNKDKAGTLMGTLLDIPAKTCKQYFSDRTLNRSFHKETINVLNPLLTDLGTGIQL